MYPRPIGSPDPEVVVYYDDDKKERRAKLFKSLNSARNFYIECSMDGRNPQLKIKKDKRT